VIQSSGYAEFCPHLQDYCLLVLLAIIVDNLNPLRWRRVSCEFSATRCPWNDVRIGVLEIPILSICIIDEPIDYVQVIHMSVGLELVPEIRRRKAVGVVFLPSSATTATAALACISEAPRQEQRRRRAVDSLPAEGLRYPPVTSRWPYCCEARSPGLPARGSRGRRTADGSSALTAEF